MAKDLWLMAILLLTNHRQLGEAGSGHDAAMLRAAEVRMRPQFRALVIS